MIVKQVDNPAALQYKFVIECDLPELLRIFHSLQGVNPIYPVLKQRNTDIINAIAPALDAVPATIRNVLVESGMSPERANLIADKINTHLSDANWLTLDDGTTFDLTYTPPTPKVN